jgi:hypothetical protein
MVLDLVDEKDCSSIESCGIRITDRKKLEDKKRGKSKKSIIRKGKDRYVYLIYWDKHQNKQIRMRVYLKE